MHDSLLAKGKAAMSGNSLPTQSDVRSMLRDAQSMLSGAASLTGEKAEQLRERGMELLDRAVGGASHFSGQAVERGKEMAHCADDYVKDNPWRTVAIAAGVGVVVGMLISRKD